jgi:hypothetical protein
MRLRDRSEDDDLRQATPHPPEGSGADSLAQARQRAEELLRAADEAIHRALSTDSQRFLQANRQQGGQ